jgi:hypothetical protein
MTKRKSRTWMAKCDEIFSDIERAKVCECELCGKPGTARKKDGLMIKGLEVHHLIERARFLFRFDPDNIIVLCLTHHGAYPQRRNHKYNPHGTDEEKRVFWLMVRSIKPEQYQWYQENKDKKWPPGTNYQQLHEILKAKYKLFLKGPEQ